MRKVYLDHNATTPLFSQAQEAMRPYLAEPPGNASSVHQFGQRVRRAADDARETMARLLGCGPSEIVFTSGGTEANNYALFGAARALGGKGRHIVTSSVEHPSVLEPCRELEKQGFAVTYLPVDRFGAVDPEELVRALRPDTILVSVMHANNEVGTIQPVEKLCAVAREHGILFHSDAVQTAGKLPLSVSAIGADLLTLSAHKMGGPVGVGLLYIRSGVELAPLILGGSQERNRRAGTMNVPAIVGFAKAFEIAWRKTEEEAARLASLREYFRNRLAMRLENAYFTAGALPCLPNTLHVCFPGVANEILLVHLDQHGIAASAGSACSSGVIAKSHVLAAMGLPEELAKGAIRFSLGTGNSIDDLNYTVEILARSIPKILQGGESNS